MHCGCDIFRSWSVLAPASDRLRAIGAANGAVEYPYQAGP
jgi:hypothetical protein